MNMSFSAESPLERIDYQRIDIESQPHELSLGDHRLQIVDPRFDLSPAERSNLNPLVNCLVIDPQTFDPTAGIGFKALRDGERIVLGRDCDYGRFEFGDKVSRRHVRITREGDEVIVEDLRSMNGTFIGRTLLSRETQTTPGTGRKEIGFESDSILSEVYTIPSDLHPERNEDAYFIDKEKPAAGVFDGVGDRKGSALASAIAAKSVKRTLESQPTELPIGLSLLVLKGALQAAHSEILAADPTMKIATTATIVKFFKTDEGKPYASIANVADSRAYLYRNGVLSFITLDSGYEIFSAPEDVQRLQDTLAQVSDLSTLSDDELSAFGRRGDINTWLGSAENPQISASYVMLEPGDQIVMTTDGVHDNSTTSEMQQCLHDSSPGHQSYFLVAQAALRSRENDFRSKADDMSAVVVTYQG